jgi:hypothetical protein
LTAAKSEQGVDDGKASLNGLGHGIAVDDGGRRALNRLQHVRGNGSLPIERTAERIDDAAKQCWPHWHAHDIARAVYSVASLNRIHIIEQDAADPVALEHLGEAELSLVEAQ